MQRTVYPLNLRGKPEKACPDQLMAAIRITSWKRGVSPLISPGWYFTESIIWKRP